MTNRNNKGQFSKGISGNYKGRPVGVKNKKMTNREVLEHIGKRKQHYFELLENIAKNAMDYYIEVEKDGEIKKEINPEYDPKLSFTCLKELINVDIQVSVFEYKKSLDGKAKSKEKGDDQEKTYTTPVLTLKK